MIGDGLNDAGALMQSDTGIAVSDNTAQFSPACDAIIDGSKIGMIHQFIAYAKSGKKIVAASFILVHFIQFCWAFLCCAGNPFSYCSCHIDARKQYQYCIAGNLIIFFKCQTNWIGVLN